MYEVEFYEDKNCKEPIKDFILNMQEKGKTSKSDRIRAEKILTYIRTLQTYGTRAGENYTKYIDNDLWELRPLKDRIFFFYWKDNTFILLHHFVKKTQKTPQKEIEQAKKNMRDYIERSKNNGN